MFRIPQPAHALTVEGCPVVVLVDTPQQLRHMLRVLFPTSGNLRFGKQEAPITMDAVAAVVRLSHKYQMDQLLAQALSALMEFYTDDFHEWIKRDRKTTMTAMPIDAITAISLAHLTSTPSILPLAYFHASCAGSKVLRGCVRDGAWAEPLAYVDLIRVMDGRPSFVHAMNKMVCRIFRPETSTACLDSRRCLRVMTARACEMSDYLEMAYETMLALNLSPCSFATVHGEVEVTTGMRLCEKCRSMLKERELEEKKELWNDIPSIFDMEEPEGWQVE
ncbi:hypothetical protein FKP32DRAFT_1677810 [Trametes sanguinea]|nr:hypothetical protein FKP32DRAFT_1677810 [Trametes sanguinea]